jgi:hypothetical protein
VSDVSINLRDLPWILAFCGGVGKSALWFTAGWLVPASLGDWILALDPLATWSAQNVVLVVAGWQGAIPFGPTPVERVTYDAVFISIFAIECALIGWAVTSTIRLHNLRRTRNAG